jgi:hypothetical protein
LAEAVRAVLVAAWLTASLTAPEVLPWKLASPLYTSVRLWPTTDK